MDYNALDSLVLTDNGEDKYIINLFSAANEEIYYLLNSKKTFFCKIQIKS